MSSAIALGVICAVGVAFFFIQLDKLKATVAELPAARSENTPSLRRRGLAQSLDRLGRRLSGRGPTDKRLSVQMRLDLAGNPLGLTPHGYSAARIAASALFVAFALLTGFVAQNLLIGLGLALVAGGVGFGLPAFLVNMAANARRQEIEYNLPDAVDLLTLAVEAGLTLDAGMADITLRFNNPLAQEFGKVIRETRLGRSRPAAMEAMAKRTGVAELHNLVQAITQSEQMGIGIAKTLRIQASELRRRRRQGAQESAARASLTMIVPMIGCIFPTLWIILLGPALIVILRGSVHH